MDISLISILLISSTFGLILRIFLQNIFNINFGFNIKNTSIINFLASFFLGILFALNFSDTYILMLLYTGFLGSFSTFSSFIYQLFGLLKKRQFIRLFFHYTEIIIFSFVCFYLGYYLIQIIKWKKKSFIYILLACYVATFLRVFINNNFIVSLIGSLFFGFFIPQRLSYSKQIIISNGFFSCFTSFSGFIYFLHQIFSQGDFIKFIFWSNFIIILNLLIMFLGYWISRKIT